jgi:hypothetical protein
MRLFIDALLGHAGVHVGVGFELKDQKENVDQKKDLARISEGSLSNSFLNLQRSFHD